MNKVYWFTGLSGSGKTTLGRELHSYLLKRKIQSYILDGDDIRMTLCRDLGFSEEDRDENQRRIACVAKILFDTNLSVIVTSISPFIKHRNYARGLFLPGHFIEIYVDTPLDECIKRDVKGLYAKKIINMTGIKQKYEIPINPDITIETINHTIKDCVRKIINFSGVEG